MYVCFYVYTYIYINMLFIPGISVVHTATVFLYACRSHILEWNQFVQKSNKTRVAQEMISAQASGGTPTTTPTSGGTPTTTPTTTEACAAVYGVVGPLPNGRTSCLINGGDPSYLLSGGPSSKQKPIYNFF